MQGWLDFSSIYVTRQLWQLYASRTMHASKNNACPLVIPWLNEFGRSLDTNFVKRNRCLLGNIVLCFWCWFGSPPRLFDRNDCHSNPRLRLMSFSFRFAYPSEWPDWQESAKFWHLSTYLPLSKNNNYKNCSAQSSSAAKAANNTEDPIPLLPHRYSHGAL